MVVPIGIGLLLLHACVFGVRVFLGVLVCVGVCVVGVLLFLST